MSETKSTTKSAVAYNMLKARLADGEFEPGERLTEVKLAKALNVNRAAVREAMLRLEGEGLLQSAGAYGGRYVRYIEDMDQQDVLAHYELREAIESLAARLAAKNMNGWQLDELTRLKNRIIECYENGDRTGRYESVIVFFRYLLSNCGNPLLLQVWEDYYLMPVSQHSDELEKQIMARQPESARPENSLKPVVDAIALRDPDEAERQMRAKVRQVTEAIRQITWSKGGR